ncbi:putative 40S ribosomal protein S10-2 [Cocos nucifera]|uniref:Putative 40S ribosomal protein S10-2 n=1 Tax=Cocos nucifera TaxID=13894 RepID=A0A8K0MVS3_COCNU|nr:putative 40S ribosomal protein S10-2 [Cocos nucifera]
MIIPKKNRHEICKYLFQEGVLYARKDYNLAKHPDIDVPNLQVIKLMQSFKSREYVRETFAWMHYYWYLTNDGIEYLRTYLNLPSEIVPATLKKSARPPTRPFGAGPPGDRPRGPPRFEGDRPRFGDRDGYRGGPRAGPPGDFGDKGGAPPEFQPSFRVKLVSSQMDRDLVGADEVSFPPPSPLVLVLDWALLIFTYRCHARPRLMVVVSTILCPIWIPLILINLVSETRRLRTCDRYLTFIDEITQGSGGRPGFGRGGGGYGAGPASSSLE